VVLILTTAGVSFLTSGAKLEGAGTANPIWNQQPIIIAVKRTVMERLHILRISTNLLNK
jgi:hypothetical protein